MQEKFVRFLKKHELYNGMCFSYFLNQSVKICYKDIKEALFMDCAIGMKNGKLQSFIPIVPYLDNDKAVAMNIYAYVQTLNLLPNLGNKYEENYDDLLLPLFYLRLYLMENANEALWTYEKKIRNKLLRNESYVSKIVLQQTDELIGNYYLQNSDAKRMGKKTKRLAQNYLYRKKMN